MSSGFWEDIENPIHSRYTFFIFLRVLSGFGDIHTKTNFLKLDKRLGEIKARNPIIVEIEDTLKENIKTDDMSASSLSALGNILERNGNRLFAKELLGYFIQEEKWDYYMRLKYCMETNSLKIDNPEGSTIIELINSRQRREHAGKPSLMGSQGDVDKEKTLKVDERKEADSLQVYLPSSESKWTSFKNAVALDKDLFIHFFTLYLKEKNRMPCYK